MKKMIFLSFFVLSIMGYAAQYSETYSISSASETINSRIKYRGWKVIQIVASDGYVIVIYDK